MNYYDFSKCPDLPTQYNKAVTLHRYFDRRDVYELSNAKAIWSTRRPNYSQCYCQVVNVDKRIESLKPDLHQMIFKITDPSLSGDTLTCHVFRKNLKDFTDEKLTTLLKPGCIIYMSGTVRKVLVLGTCRIMCFPHSRFTIYTEKDYAQKLKLKGKDKEGRIYDMMYLMFRWWEPITMGMPFEEEEEEEKEKEEEQVEEKQESLLSYKEDVSSSLKKKQQSYVRLVRFFRPFLLHKFRKSKKVHPLRLS